MNLAGKGNLLPPGRKFIMGGEATGFYEQKSAKGLRVE